MAHPFNGADRCAEACVRDVPIDAEHPTGLHFDEPCACPSFMHVETVFSRPSTAGLVREKVVVSGCQRNLFPWMMGTLVEHANRASADAEKNSGEVTRAAEAVGGAALCLHAIASAVRGAGSSPSLVQIGASPPSRLAGLRQLLLGR